LMRTISRDGAVSTRLGEDFRRQQSLGVFRQERGCVTRREPLSFFGYRYREYVILSSIYRLDHCTSRTNRHFVLTGTSAKDNSDAEFLFGQVFAPNSLKDGFAQR